MRLRVKVYEQDFFPAGGKRCAQVYSSGGLAASALLISDGYNTL